MQPALFKNLKKSVSFRWFRKIKNRISLGLACSLLFIGSSAHLHALPGTWIVNGSVLNSPSNFAEVIESGILGLHVPIDTLDGDDTLTLYNGDFIAPGILIPAITLGNGTAAGTTVNIQGNILMTFAESGILDTGNGVTVNISSTGSISTTVGSANGVTAQGLNATLNVNIAAGGFIDTTGAGSIGIIGETVNLVNNGSITATGAGSDAVFSLTGGTMTNSGVITGGDDGIDAGDGLILTNNAMGTITGVASDGVEANNNANITNSGAILGNDDGVDVIANLILVNNAMSSITGTTGEGIEAGNGANITNSGIILGDLEGVDVDDNLILVNSLTGSITGTTGEGILAGGTADITNDGDITGDDNGINATADLTLVNGATGVITGVTLNGVLATTGADITNDGTIIGDDNGINVTSDLTLVNGAAGVIRGVTLDGVLATTGANITNDWQITGDDNGINATADLTLVNGATGAITGVTLNGVSVTTGADITNDGTITGDDNGINATADLTVVNNVTGVITGVTLDGVLATINADITNSGNITGNDDGVDVDDGLILLNNAGAAITGTTGNGVEAGNAADITNDGTITGALSGIFVVDDLVLVNGATGIITGTADDGVFAVTAADITNDGDITGGDDGVDVGIDLILVNGATGTITGLAGEGIEAASNADITNDGTITGDDNGINATAGLILVNGATGVITGNTLNGVIATTGADITNDGEITGDDNGISVTADLILVNGATGVITGTTFSGVVATANATITNSGEILSAGANSNAIFATTGLTVTNECDGIIHSDGTGAASQAILATSGSITNRGEISTASTLAPAIEFTGAATNDTIIHESGTISSGNAYAIRMGGGDDTLTIRSTVESVALCGPTVMNGIAHGGDTNETNGDTLVFDFIGYCADDFQNLGENGSVTHWGQTYTWEEFENVEVTGISFEECAETPNQEAIGHTFDCIDEVPDAELVAFLQAMADAGCDAFPGIANQLSPQRYEVFSKIAFNNHDFAMRQLNNRSSLLRENATDMWDTSGLTFLDNTLDPKFEQMSAVLTATNKSNGTVRRQTTPQPNPMNDQRFGFFVSGNAVMAEGEETADIYDYEWDSYGVVGGADYKLFPCLAVGIMGGYSHTDVELDDAGSDADVESYMIGLYANWWWENFYVNGMFSYGFNEYEGTREVPFFDNDHHFDTDGRQINLGLAAGYDFHFGSFTIGPTGGIRYVDFELDGFTEGGDGIDRLTIADDDAQSLRSSLGAKATYTFSMASVAITPEVRAAWGHEFLDDSRGMTARFNSNQLDPFTIQTTDPERDWAELGGSVRARFTETISAFVDYDANVGQDDFFAHSVQGGVRLEF